MEQCLTCITPDMNKEKIQRGLLIEASFIHQCIIEPLDPLRWNDGLFLAEILWHGRWFSAAVPGLLHASAHSR